VEEVAASRYNTARENKEARKVNGFNSIFAVASIPMAMKYYTEFKRQLAERNQNLKIATIFCYSANEDDPDDALPDEGLRRTCWTKPRENFLKRR